MKSYRNDTIQQLVFSFRKLDIQILRQRSFILRFVTNLGEIAKLKPFGVDEMKNLLIFVFASTALSVCRHLFVNGTDNEL